jgi:hypothetical protein
VETRGILNSQKLVGGLNHDSHALGNGQTELGADLGNINPTIVLTRTE